jgi:hypothetical protein
MAREMGVPFLGTIPIDSEIGDSCDAGMPYVQFYSASPTAKAFERVSDPILRLSGRRSSGVSEQVDKQ